MKRGENGKVRVVGLVLVGLFAFGSLVMSAGKESFFDKSLHYSGEGMRSCYEREDGLISITGIPYKDLDCKNCHVQSCDPCHEEQKGKKSFYTNAKAKGQKTCLTCHGREALTFEFGKETETLDVHVASGMACGDCHKGEDVHGDGNFYQSMRSAEALKVACVTCHTVDTKIEAHTAHGGKVDCAACHVSNTVTCMNCHFDTFLKTGSRNGTFFPMQSWLLLINHEGKVTSGTAMSIVSKNKKFIVYAPYYTHAIQKKGRACGDCHANAAMKLIQEGESIPMMVFKDGKLENWNGVVPTVHEKLRWVYLNKEDDRWVLLKGQEPEKVQWWYGTPLTEEQIKKLAEEY